MFENYVTIHSLFSRDLKLNSYIKYSKNILNLVGMKFNHFSERIKISQYEIPKNIAYMLFIELCLEFISTYV